MANSVNSDPFDDLTAASGATGDFSKVSEFTMEKGGNDNDVSAEIEAAVSGTSKQDQIKEKGQQVVQQAKDAGLSAYNKVLDYEKEHQVVNTVKTKAQDTAATVMAKVKECLPETGGEAPKEDGDASAPSEE
jgi:hypothetical protein